MKPISFVLLGLLAAGCSFKTSRFAHDPRAAVVGPAYLDYINQYPRDRDTQYYYPVLTERGLTNWSDVSLELAKSSPPPAISRLMIDIPQASPKVQRITGKGWHKLEKQGIPIDW